DEGPRGCHDGQPRGGSPDDQRLFGLDSAGLVARGGLDLPRRLRRLRREAAPGVVPAARLGSAPDPVGALTAGQARISLTTSPPSRIFRGRAPGGRSFFS